MRRGVHLSLGILLLAVATAAQSATVSLEACRTLLASLDRAWNSGNADGYLRLFAPEQPVLHDLHARIVRARLGATPALVRTSELGTPREFGTHVVLPVHYATRQSGIPTDAATDVLRESGLVVARRNGEALVPVLAVDLPAKACDDGDALTRFSCPPCNYRLGPADRWLCVPMAQDRTAALEGATFLLLGTDIALELSVQIGEATEPADRTVGELAQRLAARVPGAERTPTEAWSPPGVPAEVDGMSTARATVDLPDGQRCVLHALALGRLRHLLLLRGSRLALLAEAEAIGRLFATYQLLQTDAKAALAAAGSLRHHSGGTLQPDGSYRNPKHHVAARGPTGWHAVQRTGGTPFQVLWECPKQSGRMWLTGYLPPTGCSAWTVELAERWLRDLAARGQLRLPDAALSWSGDAGKEQWCSIAVPPLATAPADSVDASTRHLRLCVRPNLLVLADGFTGDAAQQEAVAFAVASLQAL